jgi:hypothetical protein
MTFDLLQDKRNDSRLQATTKATSKIAAFPVRHPDNNIGARERTFSGSPTTLRPKIRWAANHPESVLTYRLEESRHKAARRSDRRRRRRATRRAK